MIRLLSPEFRHVDSRGSLVQLVSCGYSQVNILASNPGVTRGGHYHKVHEMYFPEHCCMAVLYDQPVESEHGKDIFPKKIEV